MICSSRPRSDSNERYRYCERVSEERWPRRERTYHRGSSSARKILTPGKERIEAALDAALRAIHHSNRVEHRARTGGHGRDVEDVDRLDNNQTSWLCRDGNGGKDGTNGDDGNGTSVAGEICDRNTGVQTL